MKQIMRINTFETNSSSMHSLVVSKEIKDIEDIKDLKADIHCGEFGWYTDLDNSPINTLRYLWTGLYGSNYENKLKNLFPNCNFIPFEKYEDGYIDHQSHDLPFNIIERSDEEIYNAVKNGTLYIESDSYLSRRYDIKKDEIIYEPEGVYRGENND